MNKEKMENISGLVGLKIQLAQMGGVKPFDEIERWVGEALKEVTDEIRGHPLDQPKTVITPVGQEVPNWDAMSDEEKKAYEESRKQAKEGQPNQKVNRPEDMPEAEKQARAEELRRAGQNPNPPEPHGETYQRDLDRMRRTPERDTTPRPSVHPEERR